MEYKWTSGETISMVETYRIEEIDKKELLQFAKSASQYTEDPASVNMWHEYWMDRPETFPYLVYLSQRFANDNGQFFVCKIDGELQAVSGIQISPFDNYVALGGVRSWVNEKYRGKFIIGRHLLPLQVAWAKSKGIKTIALTFNNYNKKLISYFKRSGLGIKKKRNPNSMFYNGVHEVPFTCNVQYTEQWVIYDKLDTNYMPEWEKIKWSDKHQ